ncbi:OmpA family protein [Lysobacter sp. CA199]|uniref:OmpA family protein n=1 Tax=Lysobacter sp. CA199 TaxID=3455608 RepID=UPI003F8D444E
MPLLPVNGLSAGGSGHASPESALTAPVDGSAGSAPDAAPAAETATSDAGSGDSASAGSDASTGGGDSAVASPQLGAKLYFDVGLAELPANAGSDLAGVVAALKADASRKVRVSGFHDETGTAATNAEVSKQRAQAVQKWLESQGIASDRIELDRPAVTTGGGDAKEARRVEITVE